MRIQLLRGSAAEGLKRVDSLSIPESSSYSEGSLIRAQNGHFYCTNRGFKNIYEVGLSTDMQKMQLLQRHPTVVSIRYMSVASIGLIDYLFTTAEDRRVRLIRVDGSSLTEIYKVPCADPERILWLRDRSVLLVYEGIGSVRPIKFECDFKKAVEESTLMKEIDGVSVESWIETGANRVTLFDWKKKDLFDMIVI